jgi:hypothetical protein
MKDRDRQATRMMGLIAVGLALLLAAATLNSCSAYDPQGAARQYAPSYYGQSYDSLTPQQKMHLEDHLANQSNQAWRTTASVASGLGRLAGGSGLLLFAARH